MPDGKVTPVTKPQRGVMTKTGLWMFNNAAQEDAAVVEHDFSQVLNIRTSFLRTDKTYYSFNRTSYFTYI